MRLPSTMIPIATNTLVTAGTSITFSSIPNTYTDLILVTNLWMATSSSDLQIRINGDTGSNYSQTNLGGSGSSAASNRGSNNTSFSNMYSAVQTVNGNYVGLFNFQNYSNTTTNKIVLCRQGSTSYNTETNVVLWRNTSAINQISVASAQSNNFAVGSSFTLYGIKAA